MTKAQKLEKTTFLRFGMARIRKAPMTQKNQKPRKFYSVSAPFYI